MALELNRILDNPSASPLNSLVNLTDLASSSANIFFVSPEEGVDRDTYIFDTRGEESVSLESDITDNWIEDNTTMQDHIGLKPEIITLRGYVGELTNNPAGNKVREFASIATNKISSVTPFAPKLTTQAQYNCNRAKEAYDIYKKANASVDMISDKMADLKLPDGLSHQATVYGKLYWLWKQRTLSTIYTPFGTYKNMAILSLSAKQEEDSAYISDLSVTFKKIRIAKKISTYSDPEKEKSAKAAMTMAKQQDKGVKKPSDNTSWLKHAANVGPAQAVKDLMSGRVP